jgi:hypothetical protein
MRVADSTSPVTHNVSVPAKKASHHLNLLVVDSNPLTHPPTHLLLCFQAAESIIDLGERVLDLPDVLLYGVQFGVKCAPYISF